LLGSTCSILDNRHYDRYHIDKKITKPRRYLYLCHPCHPGVLAVVRFLVLYENNNIYVCYKE